ncbi:FecR family protein [Rhodohalobacter sp. SW132]|uniref:FecR family protein n=1 Tax=Rhodohalobacter sp. SW132 TaxID=2293433 RepID=UPI0011C03F44|nr:FecR domain-containing protein [Rhodohalobacter sp. SW132]
MNLDLKDWVLIQRYVTGNATSEEIHLIEQWMSSDPENRQLVQEIKEIWDLTTEEHFNVDVQEAWKKFQARKEKKERGGKAIESNRIFKFQRKTPRTIYHIYKAVAFILVAVVAGFFFQHISNIQSDAELAAGQSQSYTLEELATDRGEKARVTFSDGTEVTLNSSSSIRFPQKFHGSTREVYLDGEAYFNVVSDQGQPFIVKTKNVNVEVLGTEFNVRGWSNDEAVDVIVREGKVSVRTDDQDPGNEVVLTEGFKTSVKAGESPLAAQKADIASNLLWINGGLHFDSVPFAQVIIQLERRFNVNISIDEHDLLNVPYTGTFKYAELDEVLMVIAASMDIEFIREGSNVEFKNSWNHQ